MISAPRDDAEQRQQDAGEDVARRRPAMGEQGMARARHVRRIGRIADHLQGEVGLDRGADVERAVVVERPAAVEALDAPQIDGNLALQLEVRILSQIMSQEHVFRGDGGVGFQFEYPVTVTLLAGKQTGGGVGDGGIECGGVRGGGK